MLHVYVRQNAAVWWGKRRPGKMLIIPLVHFEEPRRSDTARAGTGDLSSRFYLLLYGVFCFVYVQWRTLMGDRVFLKGKKRHRGIKKREREREWQRDERNGKEKDNLSIANAGRDRASTQTPPSEAKRFSRRIDTNLLFFPPRPRSRMKISLALNDDQVRSNLKINSTQIYSMQMKRSRLARRTLRKSWWPVAVARQ